MAAEDLIHPPRDERVHRVLEYIEEAQDLLIEILGTLPEWGHYPLYTVAQHLQSADALAAEHLGDTGDEERIKRAVGNALDEWE